MYLKFFGLQRLPFRLRPDREFLHLDAAYAASREALLRALRRDGSIIVLSGQAGVGKTLLLESALEELGECRLPLRIGQPQMSPEELIAAIADQLVAALAAIERGPDQERQAQDKADDPEQALRALSALGRRPVLIVDQAQLLVPETRRTLRQLDYDSGSITRVLIGCAEGAAPPAWVRGDVLADSHESIVVLPMTPERIGPYVERRLCVAGAQDPGIFSKETYRTLFQYTDGVPRLVNALCDAALSLACSRAIQRVSNAEVLAAIREPHWRKLQPQATQAASTPSANAAGESIAGAATMTTAEPSRVVISAAAERSRDAPPSAAAEPAATAVPSAVPSAVVPPVAVAPSAEAMPAAVLSRTATPEVTKVLDAAQAPFAVTASNAATAAVAEPRPQHSSPTASPSPYRLLVTRNGVTTAEITLTPGQLLIGRTLANDLVLDCAYVSRSHCALITTMTGEAHSTNLIDLGSRNGVLVNGKLTARHKLRSGDVIRVGEFVLNYQSARSPVKRRD